MKLVLSNKKTIYFDIIKIHKILPHQAYRSVFSNLGGYGGLQQIPWAGITEEQEIEMIKKNIQITGFFNEIAAIESALSDQSFTKKTQSALLLEVEVASNNQLKKIEFDVYLKKFSYAYKPNRGHIYLNCLIYPKDKKIEGS